MRSTTLAIKYNVNIRKDGWEVPKAKRQWRAYRGGNGTGQPVVDIASAYSLETLEQRIVQCLAALGN